MVYHMHRCKLQKYQHRQQANLQIKHACKQPKPTLWNYYACSNLLCFQSTGFRFTGKLCSYEKCIEVDECVLEILESSRIVSDVHCLLCRRYRWMQVMQNLKVQLKNWKTSFQGKKGSNVKWKANITTIKAYDRKRQRNKRGTISRGTSSCINL